MLLIIGVIQISESAHKRLANVTIINIFSFGEGQNAKCQPYPLYGLGPKWFLSRWWFSLPPSLMRMNDGFMVDVEGNSDIIHNMLYVQLLEHTISDLQYPMDLLPCK
jgi:hypothetical protein